MVFLYGLKKDFARSGYFFKKGKIGLSNGAAETVDNPMTIEVGDGFVFQ